MKTKYIIASLFLSAGVSSISYADTVDSTSIFPTDLKYKTIVMRDMSVRYAQYKDNICAILEV
ncbi:hypothetical protein NAI44_09730, partial [Francisella tularensis subsp. holarctica]|nr:hypothetical protein [Francisella tularensis subsp. holarctica]